MEKPLIFSDMDGTLYSSDFKAMPETLADIKFATEKSAENPNPAVFNLCTGNPVFERVLNIAKQTGARFLVGCTGAQIYDTEQEEFVYERFLDIDVIKKIVDYAKSNPVPLIFFNSKDYYYMNIDEETEFHYIIDYHFDSEEGLKAVKKYSGQDLSEIIKCEFWPREEQKEAVFGFAKSLGLNFINTHGILEILPEGLSKASGIEYVLENYYPDIKFENVMCIGDSNNDLSMLEYCGYSYAMDNAPKNVKAIAKFHTSDVKQNGLGEAIIDFLYRHSNVVKKFLLH